MTLYEFKLRKGKIETVEHGAKETAKQYIILHGRIDYNCLSRIPKKLIGEVLGGGRCGLSCLLVENDIETARKAFINFYESEQIPYCERAVQIANEAMEEAKNELACLKDQIDI